jgi:hypothetical protein
MAPPAPHGPRSPRNASEASASERRRAPWLGTCPVCGTSVLVDDALVRREGRVVHAECDAHRTVGSQARGGSRVVSLFRLGRSRGG